MKKMTNRANWRRRLLSALLAAIMVLSVIPAVSLSAFAESLGPVIVQLSGGHSQRHTVGNYQTVNANARAQYGLSSVAAPMDGSNGNPDICVPGLSSTDNMVPQGLTYWPAKNWILISSYEPNDAKPSCVYAVSVSTGRLVAQFNLQTASGATVTEHVSGIACSGNNLYIADAGSKIAYIPLSELDVAEGTVKTVRYADSVNLNLELNNANTSYASFGDGILWTGNFYISNNSSYNTKANASYGTMMLGYDLNGFTTSAAEWNALVALKGNPSYSIPLDPYGIDRVQCATVKNGFCYVGTSYGRTNDSNVYIFNVDLSAGSGTVTVNGNAKPFIRLKNQRSYSHLPMTEGLMVHDGYLWNIFESAAYLYNGQGDLSKNPTDVLWRFDVSTLLGIEREADDENGAGDAQFKAANVTCGDLTFVVPESIYLYPDALSSAQATSTPFQYYVNNNSDGTVKAGTTAMETTGKIYYSYSGAANATLSYQFYDETLSYQLTGGSANLSSGSITSDGSVNITGGQSPSLAKDTNGFYIQWKLSYSDTIDGKSKAAYAYTYVYKPYTVPVACSTTAGCSDSWRHSKRWAANVTWISGFYDIVQGSQVDKGDWDGNLFYYTKASNFSAFISQNSDGYVGGTRYTGSRAKVTSGFTVSPSSSGGSLGYVVFSGSGASGYEMDTSLNNEDAQYCGQSSSNTYTSPVKNLQAAWYSKTGAEKMSGNLYCDSYGLITIDTSRYSNLNQIPNLGVGMLVYNDESSSGSSGNWFVKDYTDCSLDGYNTWHSDGSGYYANGNYVIASQGTNYNSSGFDETEGVRYCGSWPRTLLGSTDTQGATKMYMVEGCYANKQDANPQTYSVCKLQATYYNKANLRTAVNNAIKAMAKLGVNGAANGKLTSLYFNTNNDYRWIAFQNAYKKAVIALTKLNSTQNPDALATALNNALANLCTKVTFANSNTGRGTITTVSEKTNPAYVKIGTAQSVSINPSTYVTATAKTGYSFEGWSASSTAASGSTGNISVGYNNTLYAIWKPIEYTISYNLNGGTVSGNPTSYTIETDSVLLNNPTRTGYTFAGWTGANGTTPQMDVVVPNGVSSGLSQYTTSSPYTAGGRDHILGDTFAVQSGTTYRVFVTAKRVSGTLNMQGGIWYTSQTSGASYDGYGGAFSYFRDAGNGWAVYYKDVTVPAGKQAGRFYIQLDQRAETGFTTSWQIADCSVTKFTLGDLSYTANWTPHAYTVHFNGNGETGGSTADQSFVYGTAQNLNANGFTRQYTVTYKNNNETADTTATATYTFNGWKGSQRLINDATERSYTNNSTTDYYDFPQWTISGPFAANEVFVLEFDAKGSGVVTNYFYGASNYWQVATGVTGNGTVWTGTDGHVDQALTSTFQHYKITWTLKSSGNANVNKYVLFRALKGGNSITFKNVVFYKETGAATYSNRQSVNNLCTTGGAVYEMRAQWTPGSVTLPTPTYANHAFDGWYTDAALTNKVSGATFTPTADTTLYAKWVRPAVNDAFVLDFGLGAQLDVLNNDIAEATLQGVSASGQGYTVSASNGKIAFIPQSLMTGKSEFSYTVAYGGKTYTATVTVIPAASVYYEESFVTFTNGGEASWSAATAYSDVFQNAARPGDEGSPVYGFDSAYNTNTANASTYSLGKARSVEVKKKADAAAADPTASFTFTGTGFDAYAVTSGETGIVLVEVSRGTTVVKNMVVNTYFGYSYGPLYLKKVNGADTVTLDSSGAPLYFLPQSATDGYFLQGGRRGTTDPAKSDGSGQANGWVSGEGARALYQVPVISLTGLNYGTYTVRIRPRFSAALDMTHTGKYKFILDAVRIYDPINPASISADSDIYDAYVADSEYKTSYQGLRDILLTKSSFDVDNAAGQVAEKEGVAFLETTGSKENDFANYVDIGPKNEVYLEKGQAIAFNIATAANVIPEKLCVGVKMAQGDAGSVLVKCGGTETTLNVGGSTELYREINTATWNWTGTQYKTSAPVVIKNSSDGNVIISLTKLKWSYDEKIDASSGPSAVRGRKNAPARTQDDANRMLTFSFSADALNTLNLAAQTAAANNGPTLDGSAVTVVWDKETFELGETATLTITAPATFEKAFIDGSEIAGFEENEDGMRTWTYQVTAETLGVIPADVTLKDANGYATAAIAAPKLTATVPTVDVTAVTAVWDADTLTRGETGTLSVTVPGNVVAVKVGGEEVTLFTLNEDGTRTFTWTAAPETAGQYRYTVILEEAHGYRFDAGVTPLLTVNEPAAEPADSNDGESSDDGQNGGSHTTRRFCSLLQAILNFFRRVIGLFKAQTA